MDETFEALLALWKDLKTFVHEFTHFVVKTLHIGFLHVEARKSTLVSALYKQRGKWSQRLTHWGMGGLAAMGVIMAPLISQEFPGTNVNPWQIATNPSVLSSSTQDPGLDTQISQKLRDTIISYTVQTGDTVSSIAAKFGVSADTVRWQNNGLVGDKIKVGDTLQVLPATGVAHKVQKGDTVYSIAKKYDSESQAIVDFPFNTFANDETFQLAIGQTVIVPDGVQPKVAATPRIRQITPNAGSVVASGRFVWPTQGIITQRFSWYHPGIDIANNALPAVVGADGGTVEFAGWDSTGYGNMVLINHGNGFKTRYGHLSQIYVVSGQTVNRGDRIGKMGSTGHSTGPHLHFEIYQNGVRANPLLFLK